MPKNRVVFLNSIFPVLSETFLFSQYTKMQDAGMDMVLVSSHKPGADQVHPGMEAVQKEVDYLCDATMTEALKAHAHCLFKHPLGYLRAMTQIFSVEEKTTTTLKHITGAALTLQRYCSGDQPIWIHSHFTYGATSIALWLKRIAGLPFSLTLHGSDLTFDNPPDLESKLKESDLVVCISQYNVDYVKEHFPTVEPSKLVVLPLGVAPLAEAPEPRSYDASKPLRILSVGRLSTQKAQEYLIRACAQLRDKGLAFECQLVGEGPQRAFLESEIERLNLSDQVELLGAKYHHEVLEMYKEADLFVMSSVAEGMPIVLMEAMQAGVPVLSTAISGIPELLDYGMAGILVPPASDDALAESMEAVITGEIDLDELRDQAIQHIAQNFDQGKNAIRFQQLLETSNSTEQKVVSSVSHG